MTVFGNFGGKRLREQPLDYTKFYQLVLQGQVEHVMLDKETAHARLRGDDKRYVVYVPETDNKALVGDLLDKGVVIEAKPPDKKVLMQIFILVPDASVIGVWIFFMRQMQGGGVAAARCHSARAKRVYSANQVKLPLLTPRGRSQKKTLLNWDFSATRAFQLGGRIPRGVLMVGSPGTVKRFWPKPSPGRRKYRFSPSPARLRRCSWVWVHRAFATCSNKPKSTPRYLHR